APAESGAYAPAERPLASPLNLLLKEGVFCLRTALYARARRSRARPRLGPARRRREAARPMGSSPPTAAGDNLVRVSAACARCGFSGWRNRVFIPKAEGCNLKSRTCV